MATYDLVCLQCGRSFEVFVQGFLKDEDRRCPHCGSLTTKQKLSPFLTNASTASSSRRAQPAVGGG